MTAEQARTAAEWLDEVGDEDMGSIGRDACAIVATHLRKEADKMDRREQSAIVREAAHELGVTPAKARKMLEQAMTKQTPKGTRS